jgi:hypothetical protein
VERMKLFVSHSSNDARFVELLVDLLRNALNLSAADIRCTSLDGYRLPGGADVARQLRQEVAEAPAFVALISSSSLKSVYTVFELGARWGTARPLIPLLAPGLRAQDLTPPLNNLHALASDSRSQLHQLVSDVALDLNLTAESPTAYEKYLQRILEFGSDISSNSGGEPTPHPPQTTDNSEEILRRHCEQKWPDNFPMQAHCRKQEREAFAELQALQAKDVPGGIFNEIRRSCASKWPDNFTMRLHCERQQLEAYREIQRENSA